MSFQTLAEKVAFFGVLDALSETNSDDEKLDTQEQEHRARSKAFFSSKTKPKPKSKPNIPTIPQTQPPAATLSTPLSKTSSSSRVDIIKATPGTQNLRKTALKNTRDTPNVSDTSLVVTETPQPSTSSARPVPPSLQRSATLPIPSTARLVSSPHQQSPSGTSSTRKRKRQAEANAVPEADQIFRTLMFFYIPNDNVAPARRLRIARAQQYGAKWVRSLEEATHVIVDKRLVYHDIQSVLEVTPTTSAPVIVNEDYPIDCIQFRTILNPDQARYHIPGPPHPAPPTLIVQATDTHAPSQTSNRSLQVKVATAKRRKQVPSSQDKTQSQSEGSVPLAESIDVQEKGDKPVVEEQTVEDLADDDYIPEPRPPIIPSLLSEDHRLTSSLPKISPHRQDDSPEDSAKDELSGCIEILQQYKDLPLDGPLEDDAQSVISCQEEIISESEIEEDTPDERTQQRRSQRTRRPTQKQIASEDRFACNKGGTKDKAAEAQNPNARTIEVLQSMCDYYSRVSDQWRTTAYRKAIATLKRQTTRITTAEEAYRLPNVGKRLAEKIEEIVTTDSLRRLEYTQASPLDHVLATFLKIYDVGNGRANKWISQGFRTLDDLKQKANLTPNQRIGVDHYEDLNTRIPRSEVTAIGDYIKKEAAQIDPAVELLIGGSYRRGAESSRDVDFIITKKNTTSPADLVPFFERLLKVLTDKGCVVATLSALHANRKGKDGPGSKWLGCCVLPRAHEPTSDKMITRRSAKSSSSPRPIWRRVDFLLVPETEYGAALIYFTGNDIFNRSMRLLASKKGMRLNQRGLYKEVMRGRRRVKVTEGELVEGGDERRIFETLGVKWREPEERWC
ncbi:DNA polymerase [Neurospora intermedia]|uniref:DNA polymerase lambda n=1 Tax=Neurospora intermedia TaxID=5142 RepID=A0ABR3D2S9_NEUIN